MNTHNFLGKTSFILKHILWALIAWLWYKNILFRCIGTNTFSESRWILWGIVVLFCLLGIVFEIKNSRNELNVGAGNLNEGICGCYSDNTHEIILDLDHLLNASPWELLNSVCHEAFHSYEHRLVDTYNDAKNDSKHLRLFREATFYADEFNNYINGKDDFYSYYYQNCETDAREYAEKAVYNYCQQINEYLLEKGEQDLLISQKEP